MRTLVRVVGVGMALARAVLAHDDEEPKYLDEVLVEATKPTTAASSSEVRARDYQLRPHQTLQEILNNVPGVVVRQHQGGGKATQYLVRGFNADHGTDFAVSLDGLPVNLVTHGHGQGYADANFVIPETIDHLHLSKGPYFPELGNLATAGALDMITKEEFSQNFVLAEGGSFDRQRYVLGASPKLGRGKTLLAGQAYYSNGPFRNEEHFARYNLYLKHTLDVTPTLKASLSASLYAGDWDASGQIPQREVSAGRLDRFGAIDPTEGGRTDRQNLDFHVTAKPTAQDELKLQVYASRYKLRLWSNFTFFQDSVFELPGGGFGLDPRGDGIEQNDARWLYGAHGSWQHVWALGPVPMVSTLGLQTRHDQIDVALHRQARRERFFTVSRTHVDERTVSGYWKQEIFLTDWLRFEGGLRGDFFSFDVRDRLPRQPRHPRSRAGVNPNFAAVPIAGSTTDGIVSPKANLVLGPAQDTEVYLNFGTGFHSNDARGVVQAKQTGDRDFIPLARAFGYELGARTRQLDGRLDLAASLWLIDLDSEIVFCGDCGTIEGVPGNFDPSGATRRWGIDFEARYRLTDWLTADYDLSWSDPRFRSSGQAIPIAPTLFMNGGLTADFGYGFSGAWRIRYLDDRPATEDRTVAARGYLVMDLLAKYRWRNVELSLGLLNLGDFDWQEAVFADTSCTRRQANAAVANGRACVSDRTRPDIHFTPGDPFAVRAGVTVYF
jgi:TonB dependent receptor/TonB-dependent Receptor Plug Domain